MERKLNNNMKSTNKHSLKKSDNNLLYGKSILIMLLLVLISCTACGNSGNSNEVSDNTQNQSESSVYETGDKELSGDAASKDDEIDAAKKFLIGFGEIEKKSEAMRKSIKEDSLSQSEYNIKSRDLCELWDDTLNKLWSVLGMTLTKEEMDKLTEEEQRWIADKEQQISDAGSEYEGGTIQPLIMNMKGADLTEERVRELVMLLPSATDYIDVTGTEYEDGNPGMNTDNSSQQSEDPFYDFLYKNGSVRVADYIVENNVILEYDFHPSVSYTFVELKDFLGSLEMLDGEEPEIEIAYLNNPDRNAYIISFLYTSSSERFTEFLVMSDNNGQLEINYAIDGWSRRYPTFNEYGVITDSGSNGAGAHSSSIIVPMADFSYKTLVSQDDNAAGWDFYDDKTGENVQPISNIMSEVFALGSDEYLSVIFSQVAVNDKKYYYYLSDDITQKIVDKIDSIADKYSFTFDGKDKADAAIEAYAKELGVEAIYDSEVYADFTAY
ncbi:MAG: DUF1311 domain-containing protein [Lachnospiraceae bacterium]|nr:DUF1311 domain-containing protein [Lachnospiraceae bacterium]